MWEKTLHGFVDFLQAMKLFPTNVTSAILNVTCQKFSLYVLIKSNELQNFSPTYNFTV